MDSKKTTRDFETAYRMGFKVGRDAANKYAEGYLLVDDGISANSYAIGANDSQNFTNWKVRYAEKSINFWVDMGDFTYEPPEGFQIQYLDKIEILNAEDLKNTSFACALDLNLDAKNLSVDYNNYTKILTIKPSLTNPDIKFNGISVIKFGSDEDGDLNLCGSRSFQYQVNAKDTSQNAKWTYNLTNGNGGSNQTYPNLVAEFMLLDDEGTINVEITSEADYNSSGKLLYRVPDFVLHQDRFTNSSKLTKKLSDFMKVQENPFSYSIYKDTADESTLLWTSDPSKLFFSDYFVMDSGIFATNPDNDYPLLGTGERAGSLFYKNETGGIHSRYTFD